MGDHFVDVNNMVYAVCEYKIKEIKGIMRQMYKRIIHFVFDWGMLVVAIAAIESMGYGYETYQYWIIMSSMVGLGLSGYIDGLNGDSATPRLR